jgi:copper homeostasis protein
MMATPVLEVIATSVEDGITAVRGGATRLEVVSAMEADGLTPDPELVKRLRDAVHVPLRVMLRQRDDFRLVPGELDALAEAAAAHRAAGVDGFVIGFLTPQRELDSNALQMLAEATGGAPWTLHRAFDHVRSPRDAFEAAATLPGIDVILSAGSPDGVGHGLETLRERADWQTAAVRWLAGGGLLPEHVPPLLAAGITQFHTGRAVRLGGRWDAPVDSALVRDLAGAVFQEGGSVPGMPLR